MFYDTFDEISISLALHLMQKKTIKRILHLGKVRVPSIMLVYSPLKSGEGSPKESLKQFQTRVMTVQNDIT